MFSSHQELLNLRSRKLAQQWGNAWQRRGARDYAGRNFIVESRGAGKTGWAFAVEKPNRKARKEPRALPTRKITPSHAFPRITKREPHETPTPSSPRVFGVTFRITRYFAVAYCCCGLMFARTRDRIPSKASFAILMLF